MGRRGDVAKTMMRYKQALEFFSENPSSSFEQLMVAICLTQLECYPDAMHFYGLATRNSLKDRFWHETSQPNWLVDAYVMANQPDLYPLVLEEMEAYKLDPRGKSLVAHYAYAMVCLLSGRDQEARAYVPGLLKDHKIKWTFALGKAIESVLRCEQQGFDIAMEELLKAHRGMAKFGGLRETPEGFLCLPGMSLSAIALGRGLALDAESEYLSGGYLDYLLQHQTSPP
jgi:hypothetical protein